MSEWMVYASVVSLVLAAAAAVGEGAARLWRLPRRWSWCAALLGSFLIALFAWLAPAVVAPSGVIPAVEAGVVNGAGEPGGLQAAASEVVASLPDVDGYLLWGWLLLSGVTLAAFAASARALGVQRRSCAVGTVNGRAVLLSERLGPAVVGFVRPSIVLPRWVLDATPGERELILAHEEEHLRAGDQRLVACSLLALALMPWNLALWYGHARMREAIELDCDQRVLRGGRDVGAYVNLILRASRHPSDRLEHGSPFGEPATSLERRISAMIATRPRFRSLRAAFAGSLCLLIVLAACSVDRPSLVASTADAAPATLSAEAVQDTRVEVSRVSAVPDRAVEPELIVLEVKPGPSYSLNQQPVATAELRSFLTSLYAPRPRKVLYVQAESGVAEGELNAAVAAARAGLEGALDVERAHGGPGQSATVNVVASAAR